MKRVKRLITLIMVVVMTLSVNVYQGGTKSTTVHAATFEITSPTAYQIRAAGYIDINWTAASGSVKDYKVYINGQLKATTTKTTYEYYTTKVIYHEAYVVAEYSDGSKAITPHIMFGVTKKGLGLATDMGRNISLKDIGCGWYYNWGNVPSSGSQYSGIEYVPMLWKETVGNTIKTKLNNYVSLGYKYCLMFNEPDLQGQCNMTVDAVYNLWPYAMNSDIKVSSPVSALWPQASTGWFQPFMTKINANSNLDVDFIAIHCYPDNYAGAGMASWFLEQVVDWTWETYHKPIWITEFSTTGSNVTATGGNGTKEFWEAVMPGLDSREYVERYAAFDFNSSTTGLWLYNGTFTQAGEVYKKQGNPTVDYKGNTVVPGTALEGAKYVSASDANSQKPGKVKINKVKNLKGKKIKLTFKKIKNVAGYQIRICDNKKFNGYWNKNTKKRSVTFKKLDKNTRYYFKVRAYVKNSGKKLYGSWSNVKSVKVTK